MLSPTPSKPLTGWRCVANCQPVSENARNPPKKGGFVILLYRRLSLLMIDRLRYNLSRTGLMWPVNGSLAALFYSFCLIPGLRAGSSRSTHNRNLFLPVDEAVDSHHQEYDILHRYKHYAFYGVEGYAHDVEQYPENPVLKLQPGAEQ